MPTPAQLSAIKAWGSTSASTFTFNTVTQTVAQFWAAGADNAVAAAINDLAVGTAEGKQVTRATVSGEEIIGAIAQSGDFATMPSPSLEKLRWLIQREPVNMGKLTSGIENSLSSHGQALAAFQALKTRAATVAESILGENGQATQQDIADARSAA